MSNNKKNKFYGVNDDLWGHKWGFKDSSFIINDDNTVTFTGKRYEGISGERLPYLIPFVTKVLNTDIKNLDVLLVEDIIDTGHTLNQVIKLLKSRKPKSLEVCCLLNKFSRRETDIESKWVGFDIPDEFVVGYGIDYAQDNRHLPFIGKVVQ